MLAVVAVLGAPLAAVTGVRPATAGALTREATSARHAMTASPASTVGPDSLTAGAAARVDRPVVPENLEIYPLKGWGVVGYQEQVGVTNKPKVWDFAQIGDRLFVAGSFTGVQKNYWGNQPAPPVQPQSFLAAFDADTNTWISTFRPTFNAPVLALEATADGRLLVGGAFTWVNGVMQGGLVELDPRTGETVRGFVGQVSNDGSTFPAMVRELKLGGGWLYVAGDFNRIVNGPSRQRVYSVGRIRVGDGVFDPAWRPRATGAGVNDVEPDPARQRVYLAGNFTAVNGIPGTAYQASVSMIDGLPTTNVAPFEQDSMQFFEIAVVLAGNKVWTGGSEHNVQVLDAGTRRRLDYYRTGSWFTGFTGIDSATNTIFGGGDFQVLESIDDFVIGGCHCFGPRNLTNPTGVTLQKKSLYWAGGNQFSGHRFAIALDPVTNRPRNFIPRLAGGHYGTWAIKPDTNGCLYVGGDYTRGGNGLVIGGYGRFCPRATAPEALTTQVQGARSVRLDWQRPAFGGSGISRYRVFRDDVVVGETTSQSFTVGDLTPQTTYRFSVAAVATDGRVGPAATVSAKVVGDSQPPSVPAGLSATTGGAANVSLRWLPSTDNVAVTGYLVRRNQQFLAFVQGAATVTYTDATVAAGSTYTYDVLAQDGSGNNSAPSDPARVTVVSGGVDTVAPSVPGAATGSYRAGSGAVLSWQPSTDNVAVTGYLVHRDYQFLAYAPGGTATSFIDTSLAAGATASYQVRAQDAAGNNSTPTALIRITAR